MAKKKSAATNTTWQKIKDSPFSSATELKAHEERILREEWEQITRAKQRPNLLRKEENRDIIAPFTKGFKAKFSGKDDPTDNLVKVYLTEAEEIQIEIDNELKSKDSNGTLESLVKSLTESFMSGYLTALGLKDEGLFSAAKKSFKDKP